MGNINELVGKIISKIDNNNNEQLYFYCNDDSVYIMYHSQDCCESVSIEDIVGDLSDLLHSPVIDAREESNSEEHPADKQNTEVYAGDSFTWTFYIIGTMKGSVTIRWYGSSNGYYSESVNFDRVN